MGHWQDGTSEKAYSVCPLWIRKLLKHCTHVPSIQGFSRSLFLPFGPQTWLNTSTDRFSTWPVLYHSKTPPFFFTNVIFQKKHENGHHGGKIRILSDSHTLILQFVWSLYFQGVGHDPLSKASKDLIQICSYLLFRYSTDPGKDRGKKEHPDRWLFSQSTM